MDRPPQGSEGVQCRLREDRWVVYAREDIGEVRVRSESFDIQYMSANGDTYVRGWVGSGADDAERNVRQGEVTGSSSIWDPAVSHLDVISVILGILYFEDSRKILEILRIWHVELGSHKAGSVSDAASLRFLFLLPPPAPRGRCGALAHRPAAPTQAVLPHVAS